MTSLAKTGGRAQPDPLYSTNQLAEDAGVTARTIRFYESRGLLRPQLAGSTRVYTYRDRARLALILRGKRLGFSLGEIAEYLDLYEADPDHVSQLHHVRHKARERADDLRSKLLDIEASLEELEQIELDATNRLSQKGVEIDATSQNIRTNEQSSIPQKRMDS
ncbi:MAG: MerR family DNA-binding transcriptional regulator [Rhodospirillaceae bacterium]|jgi:DNA-binding transcriptional MerR regulator|nr:MerR family DNA-binding transcriptional regulator [Rhodospirillaceae bacterium]